MGGTPLCGGHDSCRFRIEQASATPVFTQANKFNRTGRHRRSPLVQAVKAVGVFEIYDRHVAHWCLSALSQVCWPGAELANQKSMQLIVRVVIRQRLFQKRKLYFFGFSHTPQLQLLPLRETE